MDQGLRQTRPKARSATLLSSHKHRSREELAMTTSLTQTISTTELGLQPELREGFAEVGDVTLHYVEAGNGPLVVLLHGHDWGGTIAWTMAMNHPEVVDRLVILDAAHPRKLQKGLFNPRQLLRSWYFFFFTLPWLPERIVRARRFRFFQRFLRDASPAYTPAEMDRYVEAWSQPGAAKGMIDYYRYSVLTPPWKAWNAIRPISAPTLVIWGQRDRYLGAKLAQPEHHDVPN